MNTPGIPGPGLGLTLTLSPRPSITFDGDTWDEVREAVRAWLAENDEATDVPPVPTPWREGEA